MPWAIGGLGALLAGGLFLAGLAAKERDDRFCVACHLHEEKLARLSAATTTDLAGFHHEKDAALGCIACHGGADPLMRAKVWAVAGFDTVKFLAGAYAEPTHMRLPLRDAECRQCHTPVLKAPPAAPAPIPPPATESAASAESSMAAGYGADPQAERPASTNFHAIRDHDTAPLRCVRCHTAHTTTGARQDRFLAHAVVQPICRECHKDMVGAEGPPARSP